MPTDKPRIILTVTEDLLSKIDDFRFEKRVNTRSEAIRLLIDAGLKNHGYEVKSEAVQLQDGGKKKKKPERMRRRVNY